MNYWNEFWAVWGGLNWLAALAMVIGILSTLGAIVVLVVGIGVTASAWSYYPHHSHRRERAKRQAMGSGLILLAPLILVFGIPLTNLVAKASGAWEW